MTILCDWEIRALAEGGMVDGYRDELLNPASLDVTLHHVIMIESAQSDELVPVDISGWNQADPYPLKPGQFILAATEQVWNLPVNVAAEFKLKSSRAREGLDAALAMWADPGWHGSRMTLELRNNRQLRPLGLWPGQRVGQLVFHRMSSEPLRDYSQTGRYNGDARVTGSKGHV